MSFSVYFSSSAKVWDDIAWVYGIEEAGYTGWEIVSDGNYRLENKDCFRKVQDVLATTNLGASVHAPYGDLNLATLNDPIWRESIRQICSCIEHAAPLTDRVTIHPGYISPVGKMMPEKVWALQKEALRQIGRCATEHGVLACLENMISFKEFLCRAPEELMGMTEGIEGTGMTFDFGHANTTGHVNDFLRYVDKASHIHIHDNHGMSDEHLALGEGTIPWEKVGKEISSRYKDRRIVVEGRSVEEAKKSLAVFRRYFL
ncbi:sugar phosphate isomerase/epimerase family protein [Methanoregula sp.]|uniref:sugar phosphate isomerase/epimerase family protein n=1 Tax=Methanoregula sp. TaxID=2052170 RepID=UPI002374FCAB|nr:sugar phosphate isomerase/epimerase family protein [Methanoregula sp.]MDD1686899.1 sugar phosphate isomerase/epimerase [Methanoregula sp.]